ncbi:MAG: VWA domain-containing protein [Aggregatilineales bacterium]
MKKFASLLMLLTVLLTVSVLQGIVQEDTSPQLEITGINTSRLPEITVTAGVFDNTRQPITDLTVDNFDLSGTVLERATLIEVRNITDDNLPFATVLMIDTSESMLGSPVIRVKEAAKQFVQSVGDNDPIAIMSFDSTVRVVQDYTTDKDLLLSAIDSLRASGRTALYDGAVGAIEKAAAATLSRRAAIVLSDGAEFGGLSQSVAEDGLQTAIANSVSVYGIGLGFGADRRYLEDLSGGTNARFYESPSPDDLSAIYDELASLFRSQYVLTLEFADYDIRTDAGLEYDLTLLANTDLGTSNSDTSTVRVPAPIPVVNLDDTVGAVAISEPVTITPTVLADDAVQALEFAFNGETTTGDNIIIDPLDYAPGTYALGVRVTDEDGDSTAIERDLEIAALTPDANLVWDVNPDIGITDVQNISVTTGGQTPVTEVIYTLDADASTITDTENNFPFSFNPYNLSPGSYTLNADVTNAGGATTSISQDFIVGAIAPTITLNGVPEDGIIAESTTVSADVQVQNDADATVTYTSGDATGEGDTFIINPVEYAPGTYTLSATATDADDQSASIDVSITIAALASDVSLIWEPGDAVTEPQIVTLSSEGQTDLARATYSIVSTADDGTETIVATETVNDADSLFLYSFDPFGLNAGDYTLTVDAVNNGGVNTLITQDFTIGNVAPRITSVMGIADGQLIENPTEVAVIVALQPDATSTGISIAAGDMTLEDFTIDPALYPAGTLPVTVSVTDSNGETTSQVINVEIAALPPVIALSGIGDGDILADAGEIDLNLESQSEITDVTYSVDGGTPITLEANDDGTYPPLPIDSADLGDGEHTVTVTVTNADGTSSTEDLTFTVALPTATPTDVPTATPSPDTAATSQAQAEIDEQTVGAQGTQVQDSAGSVSTVGAVVQTTATQAQQDVIDTQSTSVAGDVETVSMNVTQQAEDAANAAGADATAAAVATIGAQSTQVEDTVQDVGTLDASAFGTATLGAEQTLQAQGTVDANATLDAVETIDAQGTQDAVATLDALQLTVNAEITLTEDAILAITQTFEAQPTVTNTSLPPTATDDPTDEPTEVAAAVASPTEEPTDIPTDEPTDEPTEEPTDEPTDEPTEDPTEALSPTPQATIAVEGADDSPVSGDLSAIALLCGGLGILFLILLLIWRAMRSDSDEHDR